MNRQLLELLGERARPLVVAELCSNAAPYDRATIEKFTALADLAGCAAVKLQYWRADHFPREERDRKRPYELPDGALADLVMLAHSYDMLAGASVFEAVDVSMLLDARVDFIKLAARECKNHLLLTTAATSKLPVLRSIVWDGVSLGPEAHKYGCLPLACVTHYPARVKPLDMVALRGVPMPWGWSSHSGNGLDCVTAAALGAVVVEFHLKTADSEPEAPWSLTATEAGAVVRLCQEVAGTGGKQSEQAS